MLAALPRDEALEAHRLTTIGAVRLYDTLTRSLVELPPAPGPIGMYVCGPTVYQRIHVGNAYAARSSRIWLKRWLRAQGYEMKLVRNITDINDKVYDAAPGSRAPSWRTRDAVVRRGHGSTRSSAVPTSSRRQSRRSRRSSRSSRNSSRAAWRTSRTETCTSASRAFPEYGRLSGAAAGPGRGAGAEARKEDQRDFALWKANKPDEDTSWESPWGRGRPGWHIECSAMAEKYLGPQFEIHGGGIDLVFPHHENELAQSRALGRPFARIWMHNGMLRFAGEEMTSPSATTSRCRHALDRWGRETLLVFFLTGHWRKPIDYSTRAEAAGCACRPVP